MRIARIELEQVGPFDEAAIEIPAPAADQRGELIIFEGPNGSGKTALLQSITCAAARPHAGGALGDLWPLWTAQPRLRDPASDGFALMPPLRDMVQRLRAPSSTVRLTLSNGDDAFPVALHADGIRWPADATGSPIADRLEAAARAAEGKPEPVRWAAFAYQAHLTTPVIFTRGPAGIDVPPLRGALAFGAFEPASGNLGQLLTNFDYELAKASVQSLRTGSMMALRSAEPSSAPNPAALARGAEAADRVADSRRRGLECIEDALSQAIGRPIHFEFPFGQHSPKVLIAGEEIALSMLGEGIRSTLAWLSDLLVRLQRVAWTAPDLSPLEQDFWLILDGIDEGLHPLLQSRLLPILRRLFPSARMYVSTHSPFMVASAGEGTVISLRPNDRRRVVGAVQARRLEQGQSLEWVVEEVFGAETGFIDPWTRAAINAHRLDVNRLRRKKEALNGPEWDALFERRAKLLRLNDEVQTLVAMLEVPVRVVIEAKVARSKPPPGEGAA